MLRAGRTAAAILLLLAAGLVAGLALNGDGDASGEVAEATPVAPLAERPESFLDRSVLVGAEVVEVLGPRAFVIGGDDFARGGRRILVVTRTPATIPGQGGTRRAVLEGDLVNVAGEVRRFDARAFEEEVGADLEADYDGKPAIFADSVTITPRLRPLAGDASAAEIVAAPEAFYGEWVSIEGRVTLRPSDDSFTLGDELLVLTPEGTPAPATGERVAVSGPVRRFDPDQQPVRSGRTDNEIFGDFADKPAVIAQRLSVRSAE
jgi:hypothetical protein